MEKIIETHEEENVKKESKFVLSEKQKRGFAAYLKKLRKKIEKRKAEEKKKKEKEREKKKKAKEREKLKKKKPIGRPKKRGPKKKKKYKKKKLPQKRGRKTFPPFKYKIISCKNGNQNKFIGKYRTIEEAYNEFNELKKKNAQIIFPRSATGTQKIENSIDEYVLIENNEKDTSVLRNEYGKLVEHKTTQEGWSIIDKFRYFVEEKFWVWGYDNKSERKTFVWIFHNILVDGIETKFDHKRVMTYKNKVIIKTSENYMDIIFCKTESDAVSFYNLLEKYVKKYKYKQIFFIGDFSKISNQRRKLEEEIMEITGWTKKRVQMKNMSYFTK